MAVPWYPRGIGARAPAVSEDQNPQMLMFLIFYIFILELAGSFVFPSLNAVNLQLIICETWEIWKFDYIEVSGTSL